MLGKKKMPKKKRSKAMKDDEVWQKHYENLENKAFPWMDYGWMENGIKMKQRDKKKYFVLG